MSEKKFFVKDFIRYSTPCFGCGKANDFRLGFQQTNGAVNNVGILNVNVNNRYTEVIFTKFNSSLAIWVFHKTNKILASDNGQLIEHLSKLQLFLNTSCKICNTTISSNNLEIDFNKNVIMPTTIRHEYAKISHKGQTYILDSNFKEQKSRGYVLKYANEKINTISSSVDFDLPLLPFYKLKNRETLLKKLNTYLIFS